MSFMPYVAPEQMMKDRSDYAHKGIARGRSVIGLEYADGLLFVAENPTPRCTRSARSTTRSRSPAWASTASSRSCGSRASGSPTCAATQYGREDVKARDLANAYSQALSTIFTQQMKPYEVEILVGEVDGDDERHVDLPHPVRRHRSPTSTATWRWAATPRSSPTRCKDRYQAGWDLATAVRTAVQVLATVPETREVPGRAARGRGAGPHELAAPEVPPARRPPRSTSLLG